MTEERWREIRDAQRREYNRMIAEIDPPSWEYDAIKDLIAEAERLSSELAALKAEKKSLEVESLYAYIDLLKADNEQYRIALLKIEMGHSNEETGRLAIAALNPEPAP